MGSRLSSWEAARAREPRSAGGSGGFPACSLTHSALGVDRPGVITSASPASLCASWRAVTHRNTEGVLHTVLRWGQCLQDLGFHFQPRRNNGAYTYPPAAAINTRQSL